MNSIFKDIKQANQMPIDELMELTIQRYYSVNQPFGETGDFITAPELSPAFGYTIGSWIMRQILNAHTKFQRSFVNILELGAGSGIMMKDILHVLPSKDINIKISIVESSPMLKDRQRENLKDYDVEWYDHLNLIKPDGGTVYFIIANEFFDALPIKQYIYRSGFVHEIQVWLDKSDKPEFIISDNKLKIKQQVILKDGDIIEVSKVRAEYAQMIAGFLKRCPGSHALIIDYGYTDLLKRSTLQAIHKHKLLKNPLEMLGEADLSSWVDFAALKHIMTTYEFNTELTTQQNFLIENGILDMANSNTQMSFKTLLDSEEMGKFLVLTAHHTL